MLTITSNKLFPQNHFGQIQPLVNRVVSARAGFLSKVRNGYTPLIERIGIFPGYINCMNKITRLVSGLAVDMSQEQAGRVLKMTMALNPNAGISPDGKFFFNGSNEGRQVEYFIGPFPDKIEGIPIMNKVKVEQKRWLLDSMVKSVIGHSNKLMPGSYGCVASQMNTGHLFTDNMPCENMQPETGPTKTQEFPAGDRHGNCWSPKLSYIPYMADQERLAVDAANRLYFKTMLEAYKAVGPVNLEVGCGWGYFAKMLPQEMRDGFVHLDWNHYFLDALKSRFPWATTKQGNIYELPFSENTFNNVCGLTPFVSLWHIGDAISQIHKVLKQGGRLLAFQDIYPNDPQMGEQLAKRGMKDIFKIMHSTLDLSGTKELLPLYATFVGEMTREIDATLKGYDRYRSDLNRFVELSNLYEYHEAWLINELQFAKFNVLYAGEEEVFCLAEKPDANEGYSGAGMTRSPFYPYTYSGTGFEEEMKTLTGPGKTLQENIIWGIVAEKQ